MEAVSVLVNQIDIIARGAVRLLPMLVVAILVLAATGVFARVASSVATRLGARARLRPSLVALFALLASILVWFAGVLIAAVILFPDLTPASILAGLGIGSVAIGFAFKDVFENFLAGVLILFRREMRIGDFVHSGDYEGRVERITIRETHVRQTDGQLVIIPNATLFKEPLRIITDLDVRRTTIICGVAYGEDVDAARAVIKAAVERCRTVIQDDNEVQIFAQGFGASSIDFEVTWWTGSTPVDVRRSRDEVVAAVKRALNEAGIEIPFPYRTLTFKEPLPLARADGSDAAGRVDDAA
ncbi:mechanosensitive ion channel family protein [Acuticoccus sp.]|uniref:mechanosensitive ion channel family protein n=1 Tax=Acuticoccus sp. TaxID=1904378 RepID=UPI003B52991D